MENNYDLFAEYYSILNGDVDYDLWYEYLMKLAELSKENAKNKKILDLGCGSGELLSKFYIDGFYSFGVDNSCEMLSRCDELLFKNKKIGRNCTLVEKNMQDFKIETKFDFIYSACDSINYLSEKEFDKLLGNINNMLKKGSVFTFDIINPQLFDSCEEISEGEISLSVKRKTEDDKFITDIKILDGEDVFDINFVQYVLSKEKILEIFSEYDYSEIHFFNFLETEKTAELSEKIQVVIKK